MEQSYKVTELNTKTELNSKTELSKKMEAELQIAMDREIMLKKKYNQISVWRLIIFLIAAVSILLAFTSGLRGLLGVGAIGIISFIYLLTYHNSVENEQKQVVRRKQVLQMILTRDENKWSSFEEQGSSLFGSEDCIAKDLDICGPNSLYQMICVAHSEQGKYRLAEVLKQAEAGNVEQGIIEQRQEAVRELANQIDFRIEYEVAALAQEFEKESKKSVKQDVKQKSEQEVDQESKQESQASFSPILKALAIIWPIVLLGSIIGATLHFWDWYMVLIGYFVGLIISWSITGYCQKYITKVFTRQSQLKSWLGMMQCLEKADFHTTMLVEKQQLIHSQSGINAIDGLNKLNRMIAIYNFRFNPAIHFLLNGVCIYEIYVALFADMWLRKYSECIEKSIEALTEIEMMNSLATIADLRSICYPTFLFETQSPCVKMIGGYHVLLNRESVKANSIELDAKPRVITGSNMSGKTTFLRTIGMNMILAYAGAPVCAEEMTLSIMRCFTSMRIADDVNHGISTFYAEILRIKEMVEYGKTGRPMICLIDEIFKGTNSADRIVGAEAVIRKLTQNQIIPIVSTHDFELCKLAENYHFEEYYDNEGIQFDYCLREGMCKATNALHLLRMAGLTEE